MANEENIQTKDNTEELQADNDNFIEPSFHSESESDRCLLPGGNNAFLVSPLSETQD